MSNPSPPPTVFMPVGVPAPAAPPARGRRVLLWLGVATIVLGVGLGLVLFLASGSRYEDAVRNLARAPAGCTTTLDFQQTGTFIIYVETKGEIGDVAGDCEGNDASYERDADDLPDVELRLLDPDDDEVDLDDRDGVTYDAAGFRGESIHSVDIDTAGRYRLTVTSEDTDFAIAIGKDPEGDSNSMKTIGLLVGLVGVVVGLVMVLLGRPRGGSPAAPAAAPQPMAPVAPVVMQPWPTQVAAPPPVAQPPAGGFAPPHPTTPEQGWGTPPLR